MSNIKTWVYAALFLSVSVVIPSCGSDKDDDADEPETPNTEATSGIVEFYAQVPAMSEEGQSYDPKEPLLYVCAMESRYGSSVSLNSDPTYRAISYYWNSSKRLYAAINSGEAISKTDSQKFCYYFCTSPILEDEVLPVISAYISQDQSDEKQFHYSDVLVGKTGAESVTTVNANLRHAFSRLQIECEKSMGNVLMITLKNIPTSADINLNSQSVSTDYSYKNDVVMHKVNGKSNTYEAMVPPQTFGTSAVLAEIVTSTSRYNWTPSESFTLKSNQYIEYTLHDSGNSDDSGTGTTVGISGSILEWEED